MEARAEEEAQLIFVGGRSMARQGGVGGGFPPSDAPRFLLLLPGLTGGRGWRFCWTFQGEGMAEAEAGRLRYWRLKGGSGRRNIYIYI